MRDPRTNAFKHRLPFARAISCHGTCIFQLKGDSWTKGGHHLQDNPTCEGIKPTRFPVNVERQNAISLTTNQRNISGTYCFSSVSKSQRNSELWLVVKQPLLKNMSSSVGMMRFPIYIYIYIHTYIYIYIYIWENKIPWFQTTNQSFYSAFINDQLMDRNISRALANQHLGRLIGGQLTPRHEWGYSHVYGHPPYVC